MRVSCIALMALLILPIFSHSQFQAGEWFLEGAVGASFDSNRDFDSGDNEDRRVRRTISAEPTVGWFLTDRMALLFGLDYQVNRTVFKDIPANSSNFDDKRTVRQHLVNFVPGIAFALPIVNNFGVFLEGNVGIGFGTSKTTDEDADGNILDEDKEGLIQFSTGVYPVAYYRVSDPFMLRAGLGGVMYQVTRSQPIVEGNTNRREVDHFFGFSADSFLSIGFSWFFVAGSGGEE